MFKSKNSKRIEHLEQKIELRPQEYKVENKIEVAIDKLNDRVVKSLNTIDENMGYKLREICASMRELRQQAGCGVEHETANYIMGDSYYIDETFYEICKTCGKKLAKFDTKLEADERKAVLLYNKALKAREAVELAKDEALEQLKESK